ncbi:Protein F49C12.5 a, partial [Aphelenchoides avenae]
IPFRRPVERRLDVVTCYSPLFYADRWQPIVAALEIYRQFGASLQVFYVQSMVEELLRFLRAYERQGFVRVETWSALKLDQATLLQLGYDRNRMAQSAGSAYGLSPIVQVDIDDVLIPRRGATYVDEFHEFAAVYPTAAAFYYPRVAADSASAVDPQAFSLSSLLDHTFIRKPPSAETVWAAGGKSV